MDDYEWFKKKIATACEIPIEFLDSSKKQKVQKRDLYREHTEFEKTYSGVRRFELNQHECALCGQKGSKINRIMKTDGGFFMHVDCFNTTVGFMTIFRPITFKETLQKLQSVFGTNKKAITTMVKR